MAKKIVGNYPDTDAVAELMDSLDAAGYPVESITVIADADLVDLDALDAALEDGFDMLSDVSDDLLCERIENFYIDDEDGTYEDEVTTYCGNLRNGDILVVVEDTLFPEDGEAYALLFSEEDDQDSGKKTKRPASKKAKPKAKAEAPKA